MCLCFPYDSHNEQSFRCTLFSCSLLMVKSCVFCAVRIGSLLSIHCSQELKGTAFYGMAHGTLTFRHRASYIQGHQRAIDFLGFLMQDCLMRSTSFSSVLGRLVDFCFSTLPVSLNWFIHQFKALSVGSFSPGCKLHHLRCTATTDFSSAYHNTNWAFWWTLHILLRTD